MRQAFFLSILIALPGLLSAQTKIAGNRNNSRTVFEDQPATLLLAPHVTTTIRLPDPVNSVIVGDSNLFQAEYSPNEPLLVFVRPVSSFVGQSNLVISTSWGRQYILLLRSLGPSADDGGAKVDLFVTCRAAGGFFIEDSFPTAAISETVRLGSSALSESERNDNRLPKNENTLALDEIVRRQHRQPVENLFGDRVRVGMGEVMEEGSRLIVPFSVISRASEAIELVPPQVQLSGQTKPGIFRRGRYTTVQQLPVETYRLSQRRIGPGERVDGVVVFERPAIKQSTERLLLQIADSAAIDRPTLATINFRSTKPPEKKQ
jgi:hypothetical protein